MSSFLSRTTCLSALILALCAATQSTPIGTTTPTTNPETPSHDLQRRMGADTGSYCTGDEGCQTKLCYHNVCFRYNPHYGFTGISEDGHTLYGVGSEHDLQPAWNSYEEWEGGERRLKFEDGTLLQDWEYSVVQH